MKDPQSLIISPDTPLPWALREQKEFDGNFYALIEAPQTRRLQSPFRPEGVAKVVNRTSNSMRPGYRFADAEYTVQAANNFPQAIALLSQAAHELQQGQNPEMANAIREFLAHL